MVLLFVNQGLRPQATTRYRKEFMAYYSDCRFGSLPAFFAQERPGLFIPVHGVEVHVTANIYGLFTAIPTIRYAASQKKNAGESIC